MTSLNADVLEQIFKLLDFGSLLACELTCKKWKEVINDRRLYWQLSKALLKKPVTFHIPKAPSAFKAIKTRSQLNKKRAKDRRFLYRRPRS